MRRPHISPLDSHLWELLFSTLILRGANGRPSRASMEVSCAIHGRERWEIVPADGADGAGGAGPRRLAASAPMEAACAPFRGRAIVTTRPGKYPTIA
jgi:hypothetical protein